MQVVTLEAGGWLAARLPKEARRRRAGVRPAAERVRVWHGARSLAAQAWRRESLAPGQALRGPAIVSDDGATLWLAPGWQARAHASGALVVTRAARR